MNRYSTGRRGKRADREAAGRFSRLRAAGVPSVLSAHEAYYLSGGILGEALEYSDDKRVSLAFLAKRVPDAESFIEDWKGTQSN